jgi:hypothetical protein
MITLGALSKIDWPALDGLQPRTTATLRVEQAIWGRGGPNPESGWIARSKGFQGDPTRVVPALQIGDEDRPAPTPLWRVIDGRYYAVWCYPSPAVDTLAQSNLLKKQILEWAPSSSIPTAAAALILLLEASKLEHKIWSGGSSGPGSRVKKPRIDIPALNVRLSVQELESQITEGLRFWRGCSRETLVALFTGIEQGVKPCFLAGMESPLPPAALASLLLPFPRNQSDKLSLCGWTPAQSWGPGENIEWDVVATGAAFIQTIEEPSIASSLKSESLLKGDPSIARGPQRGVTVLLDFAASRQRWLDLARLPGKTGALSRPEEEHLRQAIQKGRAAALGEAGLPEELAEARRRHLAFKADVIEAACHRLFGWPAAGGGVKRVLNEWKQDESDLSHAAKPAGIRQGA